jgi:hypothetical protein
MRTRALVACLSLGALVACGGSNPPAATATVAAPPETTSLTFLLRMHEPAGTTAHSAMEALRLGLVEAGYRIVVDPRARHDAEILCRASVLEEAYGFGATDYSRSDLTERVALTATVVSRGRAIDEATIAFVSANLQISAMYVQPLVNRLNASQKIAQLGSEVREEGAARQRAAPESPGEERQDEP